MLTHLHVRGRAMSATLARGKQADVKRGKAKLNQQSEAKPGKLEAEGKLTGDSPPPPKKKPEAPSISNENQSTPSALAVCEGVCVCKRESVCVSVKERQSACESVLVCVC